MKQKTITKIKEFSLGKFIMIIGGLMLITSCFDGLKVETNLGYYSPSLTSSIIIMLLGNIILRLELLEEKK